MNNTLYETIFGKDKDRYLKKWKEYIVRKYVERELNNSVKKLDLIVPYKSTVTITIEAEIHE